MAEQPSSGVVVEEVLIEILDIEEFYKANREPKKAKLYRLKIDKVFHTWPKHRINGTELITLAEKKPVTNYKVYEHVRHHQPRPIGPDEYVELHKHHLERFTTLPMDQTEGVGG